MVQLFIDGGGFMWPILFIFIIGFVFVGERLYHLLKGLSANEAFANNVATTLASSGVEAAKSVCSKQVGPVANLCYAALERAEDGVESAEKTLEQGASIEMASLEKNMTWISLCIATAPMLGFLGTVWGMLLAFGDVPQDVASRTQSLARDISVALWTTVLGLLIAIPALTSFAIFRNRIAHFAAECTLQAEHAFSPLKRARNSNLPKRQTSS